MQVNVFQSCVNKTRKRRKTPKLSSKHDIDIMNFWGAPCRWTNAPKTFKNTMNDMFQICLMAI